MKSLTDYINESLKHSVDHYLSLNHLYNDMLEFYDNEIPKDIQEKFLNNGWVDYVEESLKTHDINKLINKLNKEFKDQIQKFEKLNNQSLVIYLNDDSLEDNEFFNDILKFFNYTLRQSKDNKLLIEPIYSEDVSKYVYDDCNGIIYHFTDKQSAKYILKNGLKIRGVDSKHRKIPKRIYLYAPGYYLNSKNKDKWIDFAKTVIGYMKYRIHGLSVLKIDLHKLYDSNISFYKDTSMDEKESIFTLNNIPAICISELNI